MRDAQRIELKPDEYRDAKALERQQTLRELLAILRRAAVEGADWYYGALSVRERCQNRQRPNEPEQEPDPDSPFQPPAPRYSEPEQLTL